MLVIVIALVVIYAAVMIAVATMPLWIEKDPQECSRMGIPCPGEY